MEPQLIPDGELVTVPLPDLVTDTAYVFKLKTALTDFAASIVRVHGSVPEQPLPPLQPEKTESLAAVGVIVTDVP